MPYQAGPEVNSQIQVSGSYQTIASRDSSYETSPALSSYDALSNEPDNL